MTTLGIFTVKRFHKHEGRYFTYGGFGGYLSEIRRYFDETTVVAHVRRAPPAPGFYEVDQAGLKVVELPYWPTELGALACLPITFWRAFRHIGSMDVVHARMPDYTGVVGALTARLTKTPCFHQIIDDWRGLALTIPAKKKFGLGLVLKLHLLLYDYFERLVSRGQLVFAQGAAAYAKHERAADAELTLSSAHRRADMGRTTPRFSGPEFTILSVGRLHAVKNQQLVLRALRELLTRDERWRLVLVGEGGKKAELERLSADLGVADRVRFVGRVSHGPELWSLYDEADVFVLASTSEGTPKVVLEAMCRGAPVVASAVSGVPTAVADGERGLLFQNNDLQGLIAALERMRDEPELRARCADAAYAFAEQHTLESSTERMMAKVLSRFPHLALQVPVARTA